MNVEPKDNHGKTKAREMGTKGKPWKNRTDFFKRVLIAPKMPISKTMPKVSDIIINNTKYYKRTQHSTGFCLFSGWYVLWVCTPGTRFLMPGGSISLSGSIVSYIPLTKS